MHLLVHEDQLEVIDVYGLVASTKYSCKSKVFDEGLVQALIRVDFAE
jgi:hypothetical protein